MKEKITETLARWLENAKRPPTRSRSQRGMTLVEIMVVVVIISLVAGTVGVAVFNALSKAQADTARTQMRQISDALDLYKLSNRKYPSSGEGLQALTSPKQGKPTMEQIPQDPWGNDYVYVYPGQHNTGKFDLISYGEDGSPGGGDDIIFGKMENQE